MGFLSALPPGKLVVATADFGPVLDGQPGIVVARQQGPRLPWRAATYVCTFLGGTTVTLSRRHIVPQDHGYSRLMLEDPWWFLHTRTVPGRRRRVAGELGRSTPSAK